MSVVGAGVATVVLAALSVVQVLVATGRPLGRFVWGGRHRVLPLSLRLGSVASVVLYAVFGALLWSRLGVLPGGGSGVVRVGTWVFVGYCAVGVGLNAVSRSRAERVTMTPACVVLGVSGLLVALGPGA